MARQSKLMRKSFAIAAAIAMPMSMVAFTTATASASSGPPDPAVTCALSATISFSNPSPAPPGISKAGSIGPDRFTVWLLTKFTLGGAGCSGSGPGGVGSGQKTVHCDKHTPGLPATNPACQPGFHGFDSWANFDNGGLVALGSGLKGDLGFAINGITYLATHGSVTAFAIPPGGLCGASEEGFQVVGTPRSPKKDRSQTITMNNCLGAITGTGLTSSSFLGASIDQNGAVATVQIDPATSTVHIG
jgi:hypothetical protein